MAKRFTDTEKWDRAWFQELPTHMKLLWMYLCDKCDAAGIWSENLSLACYQIGETITHDEYEHYFGTRMVRLKDDKVFFPGFIEFQYGSLSPESRPHLAVIRLLERIGIDPKTLTLSKGYPKGIGTLKDKDKEQDKEQDKEEGGVGETKTPASLPPSPLVAEPKTLAEEKEILEQCYQAWLDTLAFYKAARPQLSPQEQLSIARAVQRQGRAKAVLYALIGARHEPKSETYDPAKFLKINRVLDPEHFNRFMNLGVQAENKRRESA